MHANSNEKDTEMFLFQYDTKSYYSIESYIKKSPLYTNKECAAGQSKYIKEF